MMSENSESPVRVSNWTLATGMQPGHRSVPSASHLPTERLLRKVVVVTRHPFRQSLKFLLNAGDGDVVFLESIDHAYSHIKRVHPDLVIVRLEMDDTVGFQVLSMLKLDPDTSCIPIVVYATAQELEGITGTNTKPNAKADAVIGNLIGR